MQTPPAALPLATTYLRVIFTAMPLVNILALLTMAMRGVGDARTPFRAMMAVAALDAVLNPVLIAGLGPAPRLGIAGAAGATLLAQGIVLVVLLHVMRRRQDVLALRIKDIIDFRPDWPLIRRIALKGLPMGLEMIVLSISAILMIALVNDFGTRTSAAYGIAVQLWTYVQMPAMAIGQAITAIAAQCIGAGLWHRVSRIVRMGVLFNLALTGAIIALLYVLERPALTLFLPHDRAAVDVARHINAIALWSYLPFGMTFVLFGVVRAAGVTSAPLVVLLVTSLGLRIPFAFLLVGRMGLDAVWWSFPLGFCASTLLAAAYYRSGRWRHAPLTMPDTASDAPETGLGLPTQLAAQHQPAGA